MVRAKPGEDSMAKGDRRWINARPATMRPGFGPYGAIADGALAAMRAQGLPGFEAACAGALLHSLAGDAAAREGQRGLLPSDLLPWLRRLANPEA